MFPYMQNQFFISGLSGDEVIQNRFLEALYRRIMKAHKEEKCFRVIVIIPLLPGFQVMKFSFLCLLNREAFIWDISLTKLVS